MLSCTAIPSGIRACTTNVVAGTPKSAIPQRDELAPTPCQIGVARLRRRDHLVILCRRGKAEAALQSLREIMGKLKLTVNEAEG